MLIAKSQFYGED